MNNDDLNTFASIFKNRNPLSIHGYLADTLSNILSFVFISLLFLVVYGVIKFELDFNTSIIAISLFIFIWVMFFGLLSVLLEMHKNLKNINLKLKFQNEIAYTYLKNNNLIDLDKVIESVKSDADSHDPASYNDSLNVNEYLQEESQQNKQTHIETTDDPIKESINKDTIINIVLFIGVFAGVSLIIIWLL